MNKLLSILPFFILQACNSPEVKTSANTYFDTAQFVESEIEALSQQSLSAKKIVSLGSNTETVFIENVTPEFLLQEFMLLKEANFNKGALLGRYSADTLFNQNNIYKYTALDKKLRTQRLIFEEDVFIEIVVQSKNFMNSYEKEFLYKKGTFIGVKGWQKSLFEDTLHFNIEVILLPN